MLVVAYCTVQVESCFLRVDALTLMVAYDAGAWNLKIVGVKYSALRKIDHMKEVLQEQLEQKKYCHMTGLHN
jgi:hypothetical protein